MPRVAFLFLPLALAFAADQPKLLLRSLPFEVVSTAGVKPAREVMTQLLQLRHYLGAQLGKPDLDARFPIRIVVVKERQAGDYPAALGLGRDAYTAAVAGSVPSPELMRSVATVLLESNIGRMPNEIERGLLSLVSTLTAAGPRITLGAAPPASERTPDWARLHLLAVNPDYAGKLRVLLYNLQHGIDLNASARNAFGKPLAELDREAASALSGAAATAEISGMPLSPERDLVPKDVEAPMGRVYLADLYLATSPAKASTEYAASDAPAAKDGLALAGKAEPEFKAAIAAGSRNPRVYYEFARLTQDPARRRSLLDQAARLNPKWAEPLWLLASTETDLARKAELLRQATARDPRNVEYWQALAAAELKLNHFQESDRAWVAAERATGSKIERERILAARAAIDEQRIEQEAAERRRVEEEKQRELQDLKNRALERIRVAEMKANKGQKPMDPNQKVLDWWDAPVAAATVKGRLERVECLNGPARLTIRSTAGKLTLLLIRDPKSISIGGAGEHTFSCGFQKPPRPVTAGYNPKPDPKWKTSGEAVSLEFP